MKILYSNSDGRVFVVNVNPKSAVEKMLGPLSDEDYRKHVWEVSVPKDAVVAFEINDDFVFPDRAYRDAWVLKEGVINLDAEKVSQIDAQREKSAKVMAMLGIEG